MDLVEEVGVDDPSGPGYGDGDPGAWGDPWWPGLWDGDPFSDDPDMKLGV